MARVAVVAARDAHAEAFLRALRTAPQVERAERVPHQAGAIDPAALEPFDTLVYSPLPPAGRTAAPDVAAARALSERLISAPLRHAVIVSSAAVYGPNHQNAGLLAEDAFIADGRSEIADGWRAVERLTRQIGERSGAPPTLRAVLRPAAVLDGRDYFSRLLKGRVAVTYPGHDPTLQFLGLRDLARAVAILVSRRGEGIYNVAPAAAIPLKHALRLAGVVRLPLLRLAQNAARAVVSPAGLAVPADQLKYLQYSWTVSGEKLRRQHGFAPSQSSAQAVLEITGRNAPEAALPAFDEFGMDPDYIRRYCRHLFNLLHNYYWRVEVAGIENVPRDSNGVLVGVHRGFMPFDGTMALYALVTMGGRIPRFLIHPSLTKFPFLADFMAKLGGIMACQENGDFVLQRGELLAVYPEGIRGAFTMYRRAYTLGKFGRDEFVRFALRNRAPLLPFVTVGSAEIYPILARIDWRWFKRYTEWPFLPITAAPFPLPSKWHTRFLPPMHIERDYGPEAADNPRLVHQISLECRQRMQAAIDDMLLRRRSIFFGSIFERPEDGSHRSAPLPGASASQPVGEPPGFVPGIDLPGAQGRPGPGDPTASTGARPS
jgi:1-acyl-sn-glycerol-3-phosphate acyltransferase/nucleoside-diphosphate-sugar epimerase